MTILTETRSNVNGDVYGVEVQTTLDGEQIVRFGYKCNPDATTWRQTFALPLQDAIAFAKAILALQETEEQATDEAAWLEALYEKEIARRTYQRGLEDRDDWAAEAEEEAIGEHVSRYPFLY